MSRFRIKKQSLIAVAGIVWLLAGLNVAILGVRAAIDMRGVAAIVFLALAGGAIAIFCAFHPMFSKLVQKNAQRIADLDGDIDTFVEGGRAHVSIVREITSAALPLTVSVSKK
mgnify:CR=1 FL=1